MLKHIALAIGLLCALIGCAGDSSVTPNRFAGSYTGTWENSADATDAGTSSWHIDGTGAVRGQDLDPTQQITYNLVGHVTDQGQLTSMSSPNNGTAPASLNGPMQFNGQGQLTGLLVWGVEPPLTYRYTFTRQN